MHNIPTTTTHIPFYSIMGIIMVFPTVIIMDYTMGTTIGIGHAMVRTKLAQRTTSSTESTVDASKRVIPFLYHHVQLFVYQYPYPFQGYPFHHYQDHCHYQVLVRESSLVLLGKYLMRASVNAPAPHKLASALVGLHTTKTLVDVSA